MKKILLAFVILFFAPIQAGDIPAGHNSSGTQGILEDAHEFPSQGAGSQSMYTWAAASATVVFTAAAWYQYCPWWGNLVAVGAIASAPWTAGPTLDIIDGIVSIVHTILN